MNNASRLFILVALSMLLWACSHGSSETPFENGIEHQILHYGNADEPQYLDPHLSTGSPDNNIIINLFEGLTRKNHQTLKPEPGVAKSWTISDDGKEYRFELRKDARWSNGDPITAHDFVYSWRRSLTPTLPNHYAYTLYYLKNGKDYYEGKISDFSKVGVTAVSDYELLVELEHPVPYFLQILDHHPYYPVHKATIEAHGGIDESDSRWTLPENFVGNGAFTLGMWEINKVIVLKKNEHYWDADNVKLKEAHIYPIQDKMAEERAFRTGQIHLTNTPHLSIEKIAHYKKNNPEVLRIVPIYSNYYYIFNHNVKPLDDVRVRKAIAYAIDRKAIVENVTKGGEKPAFSFVPPDPEGYTPKTYFEQDIEEAKRLLAEAGFPNGEGFPVFSILYNTNDNHRKVAVAIQQMLKNNLNIDVQLENKEWKVYLSARHNLEHEIARAAWIADFPDPSNFFGILYSHSGNSNTAWVNKEYDALVEEAARTSNKTKRYELFEKANKILADEMPVAPIYYESDVNLVSPVVKGWYDNVMHYHPLRTVYLSKDTVAVDESYQPTEIGKSDENGEPQESNES